MCVCVHPNWLPHQVGGDEDSTLVLLQFRHGLQSLVLSQTTSKK